MYLCSHCDSMFDDLSIYLSHKCRDYQNKSLPMFFCDHPECDFVCLTKEDLDAHQPCSDEYGLLSPPSPFKDRSFDEEPRFTADQNGIENFADMRNRYDVLHDEMQYIERSEAPLDMVLDQLPVQNTRVCQRCKFSASCAIEWVKHLDECLPLRRDQVGAAPEVFEDPILSFEEGATFSKSQDTRTTQYEIRVADPLQYGSDRFTFIDNLSESVARRVREIASEGSRVNVQIQNEDQMMKPFHTGAVPREKMTGELILTKLAALAQSKESLVMGSGFKIVVQVLDNLSGKGEKSLVDFSKVLPADLAKSRCIVRIRNGDNLCMPRAIVIGMMHHAYREKEASKKDWDRFVSDKGQRQRRAAIALCNEAGVDITDPERALGIGDMESFSNILTIKGFGIAVWDSRKSARRTYDGNNCNNDTKKILLYLSAEHYSFISMPAAFFQTDYFCFECLRGYKNKVSHKCIKTCSACKSSQTEDIKCDFWVKVEDRIECQQCNRLFFCLECFKRHLSEISTTQKTKQNHDKKSVCSKFKNCKDCGENYEVRSKYKHVCNHSFCKYCGANKPLNHRCFYERTRYKDDIEGLDERTREHLEAERLNQTFVFFDCETTTMTSEGLQACHLVRAEVSCHSCRLAVLSAPVRSEQCHTCGSTSHVTDACICREDWIEGCSKTVVEGACDTCKNYSFSCHSSIPNESMMQFQRWVCETVGECTVIAHNFSGFDGLFYKSAVIHNGFEIKKQIADGTRIFELVVGKTRAIDSAKFIPIKLSAFPKSLDLNASVKKGFFPYKFDKVENWNYIGKWPALSFYEPEFKNVSERIELENWYDTVKDSQFDFRKEIEAYCGMDVTVLQKGCLKFRESFLSMPNLEMDPFFRAPTISSFCMDAFQHSRSSLMTEQTVGIISGEGYCNPRQSYSDAQKRWLDGLQIPTMQTAESPDGEKRICGRLVDGYESISNTVYQFNGCYWHSCPRHREYRQESMHPHKNKPHGTVFAETVKFEMRLRAAGYNVVTMWECDLPEPRDEETHNSVPRSLPQEAYYGGRVEAFRSIADSNAEFEIRYRDITSLYPYCMKYKKYPVGHPDEIITNPHLLPQDMDSYFENNYFGFVVAEVIAPSDMKVPLLPFRYKKRLHFPLCRSCAINNQQTHDCSHTENERSIIGAWATPEFGVALKLGYKLVRLHSVWSWNEDHRSLYTPGTESLFSGFVNLFYKIKTEADGYPAWVHSETDKDDYIRMVKEKEDIVLDKANIRRNPGLRFCAKIMLNSFYGKFGQKDDKKTLLETSNVFEKNRIVFDDDNEIFWCDVIPFTNWYRIVYRKKKQCTLRPSKCNVPIAMFTTSHARLCLYMALANLDERLIYCDTDSVIYLHPRSGLNPDGSKSYEPELGDFLGDWTDEVDGCTIDSVVCRGPKVYSYKYKTKDGVAKEVVKSKGITLSSCVSEHINYSTLRQNDGQIKVPQVQFRRTIFGDVNIKKCEKSFRETFKRFPRDGSTFLYPYGYVGRRVADVVSHDSEPHNPDRELDELLRSLRSITPSAEISHSRHVPSEESEAVEEEEEEEDLDAWIASSPRSSRPVYAEEESEDKSSAPRRSYANFRHSPPPSTPQFPKTFYDHVSTTLTGTRKRKCNPDGSSSPESPKRARIL